MNWIQTENSEFVSDFVGKKFVNGSYLTVFWGVNIIWIKSKRVTK